MILSKLKLIARGNWSLNNFIQILKYFGIHFRICARWDKYLFSKLKKLENENKNKNENVNKTQSKTHNSWLILT